MCAAMARTGTRLRLASNSPLIRCRLPGPQLPAHTASSPVSAASAAAAKPAASSCLTCSQVISPSRRSASVNPFSESPGSPYTRRTPDLFSVATITSATVVAIVRSFCARPQDDRHGRDDLGPGDSYVAWCTHHGVGVDAGMAGMRGGESGAVTPPFGMNFFLFGVFRLSENRGIAAKEKGSFSCFHLRHQTFV